MAIKIDNLQRPNYTNEVAQNPNKDIGQIDTGAAFAKVLDEKLKRNAIDLKFSAHAIERLSSRNILLNDRDISKLSQGLEKIEQKGGKESLMIMGDLAFIVNIKNKIVITAVDNRPGQQDKVFTNIDSALII